MKNVASSILVTIFQLCQIFQYEKIIKFIKMYNYNITVNLLVYGMHENIYTVYMQTFEWRDYG